MMARSAVAARPGGVAVLVKALGLVDLLAQHGEMTPARLAELLDEPRSTVETRIYRGLRKMRTLVDEESRPATAPLLKRASEA